MSRLSIELILRRVLLTDTIRHSYLFIEWISR